MSDNAVIRIEETGTSGNILINSCHARANHFIKQSRPNRKLWTYIQWPYFLSLSTLVLFYSSLGYIVPIKEATLVFSIICAVFFLIYCQHELVNQTSLPVILLQFQPTANYQAGNKEAVQYIRGARCQSRTMMVLFFLATVYNIVCTVRAYTGDHSS